MLHFEASASASSYPTPARGKSPNLDGSRAGFPICLPFYFAFLFYIFQFLLTGFCRSPCSNLQSASPSASSSSSSSSLYRENSGIITVTSLAVYSPPLCLLSVCLNACVCLSLARPRAWPGTLAFPPPVRCKRRLVVRSGGNHHAICFLAFSYTLFASSVSSASSPPLFLRLAGCAAFLVPQYKREREI